MVLVEILVKLTAAASKAGTFCLGLYYCFLLIYVNNRGPPLLISFIGIFPTFHSLSSLLLFLVFVFFFV